MYTHSVVLSSTVMYCVISTYFQLSQFTGCTRKRTWPKQWKALIPNSCQSPSTPFTFKQPDSRALMVTWWWLCWNHWQLAKVTYYYYLCRCDYCENIPWLSETFDANWEGKYILTESANVGREGAQWVLNIPYSGAPHITHLPHVTSANQVAYSFIPNPYSLSFSTNVVQYNIGNWEWA